MHWSFLPNVPMMERVYGHTCTACVHLMFLCIMNERSRLVSKNAAGFLRGPRRIAILNKKNRVRTFAAAVASAYFKRCSTASRHWRGTVSACIGQPRTVRLKTIQNAFRFLSSLFHTIAASKNLCWKIFEVTPQVSLNNKVDRRTSTLVTLLICFALLADCIEFLKYLVIVLQFVDCS